MFLCNVMMYTLPHHSMHGEMGKYIIHSSLITYLLILPNSVNGKRLGIYTCSYSGRDSKCYDGFVNHV